MRSVALRGDDPPLRSDLVTLAERIAWLSAVRVAMSLGVIVIAVELPRVHPIAWQVGVAVALAYGVASALLGVSTSRGRRPAVAMLSTSPLLDGLFLAWIRYATGGLLSPLAFLMYAHVAAIAIVVSYRTGAKVAVWHSMLLLASSYAQATHLLPTTEISSDLLPGGALFFPTAILSLGGLAIVTAVSIASSSLSEREIRAKNVDLSALSSMVRELSSAGDEAAISRVLITSVRAVFGFTRGAVVLIGPDGVRVHDERATRAGRDLDGLRDLTPDAVELLRRARARAAPEVSAILRDPGDVVVVPMSGTDDASFGYVVLESRTRSIKPWVLALVRQFVAHASLAIGARRLVGRIEAQLEENRDLQRQLEGQKHGLELAVADRTRRLTSALGDVRELADDRRRLLGRLVDAQEHERRRVANDLHDDPLQKLAAVSLQLQLVRKRESEDVARAMDEPLALVGDAIDEMRNMIFELRPTILDQLGLAAALREYVKRSAPELDARVVDDLDGEPFEETRVVMYRIAQEALANVRKHAAASRVDVTLEDADDGYVVRVTDDGRGFESPAVMRSEPGHLGMSAMRERAETLGGWCRVESEPGAGTTVECWLPSDDAGLALSTPVVDLTALNHGG